MGVETTLFSSKETKPRGDVASFLHNLADRIETGQVTLRQGGNEIVLDLPGQVTLEMKVEDEVKRRKGIQHSLEVELKWFDGDTPTGGVELG